MNRLIDIIIILCTLTIVSACKDEDEEETIVWGDRTVIVYLSGENSLSSVVATDIEEMKRGSRLIGNNNLVVYVDRSYKSELPWLARIRDGQITDSVSVADIGIDKRDVDSSDPTVMKAVLHYAVRHYPARRDYGLVLWGHSTGWLSSDFSARRTRAYGIDNGHNSLSNTGNWMTIPDLQRVLSTVPHLKFIFADCCNFMCLESLYELRNVADYIIGSPAEIPEAGAFYTDVVPALFESTTFAVSILNKYRPAEDICPPLAVVKTSEMENVAHATRNILQTIKEDMRDSYPDMTGIIHYYNTNAKNGYLPEYNIFYDAGDFFRHHAPEGDYRQWKESLNRAVVGKTMATRWETDKVWSVFYSDFTMTEDNYHGVSMFVPQDPSKGNYANFNQEIRKLAWYHAVNPENNN